MALCLNFLAKTSCIKGLLIYLISEDLLALCRQETSRKLYLTLGPGLSKNIFCIFLGTPVIINIAN
jgi:hypothetical protein